MSEIFTKPKSRREKWNERNERESVIIIDKWKIEMKMKEKTSINGKASSSISSMMEEGEDNPADNKYTKKKKKEEIDKKSSYRK